ncbi:MAG: hypothetical protein HFI91_13740 [Lachnospiraceae bacterium]|nr:hypothetical protein [Lachnospiraceae bacterium]
MEIQQFYPLFEEGRILKKDALNMIRDYAPDFFSLLFRAYGDGVVAGFQIYGQGREIRVSPGILKSGASFFCMREEAGLEYTMQGQMVQILLRKLGGSATADFQTQRYGLSLEPVRALGPGEYELGRFLLEQGARLRTYEDYKDFHDLVTGFNTLNPVYIPFACEHNSTLSPCILRLYGKGVLHSAKAAPLDLSFAALCLNSPMISAELICNYITAREHGEESPRGNLQMYQSLARIYTRLVSGSEVRQRSRGMIGKTIID